MKIFYNVWYEVLHLEVSIKEIFSKFSYNILLCSNKNWEQKNLTQDIILKL